MSDFLQFNLLDRVPSLPNRKKITFDDDTVKYARIEYADEPIEEGTRLNKATFDKLKKINSNLGYNILEPTKVLVGSEDKTPSFETIEPTWSFGSSGGSTGTDNIKMTNKEGITLTISSESKKLFYNQGGASVNSNYINFRSFDSTSRYTSANFLNACKNANKSSSKYISFMFDYNGNGNEIYYLYDFGSNVPKKITLKAGASSYSVNITVKKSSDNITWTDAGTYTINNQEIQLTDLDKYVKVYFKSQESFNIFYAIAEAGINQYSNEYSVDYDLINNQRLLIQPSNTTETANVILNTINQIPCDTLLQPSTYYDLVYKEDANKIIAKEVTY